MVNSKLKIEVLTPRLQSNENKYLTCLWSSLNDYNVQINAFSILCSFFELLLEKHHNKIIHLHWVRVLCFFDSKNKYKTLIYFLITIRNLITLRLLGNKIVWTVHNTHTHNNNFPVLEHILRWFLSRICSDIIVMSEYSRKEFAHMYGRTKQVHIIPHGNYIGSYPNQVSRSDARLRLGIAPKRKVILYFGMVRHYKGINNLIAAFNQIENPNVILLIAGIPFDRDLCAEIEQAARKNPKIQLRLEYIPDEDIQIYMNACDWVVLPYQKILNSGSVLLALSFARPVIAPQKGSIPELISNKKQGYCYDKDCNLLATINNALATTDEEWEEMCTQAYALAQKYDWSKIGYQLYQIYSY
ncbi:glycosyltransferase [Myxosarcina sp. GI1]|uniref:glycosyltransferase n=1 Tax=Myxosarcina sp. GI1 TaxID=1541065 RepID=UPI00068AB16E|nr:glycosyltransferase [Myxosarcina sp. GI1]